MVIEPGHPFQRCQLDGLACFPGAAMNQFSLVQAVDRFSEGIIVAVAPTADRRFDARFGEPLAIANADVLRTSDALLNVKLVCHFSECKAARFREAVAGCPPPAGAVVVVGDRAGQPWTTRAPQHTFRSQTPACCLEQVASTQPGPDRSDGCAYV